MKGFTLLVFLASVPPVIAGNHPLSALTADEMNRVVQIMEDDGVYTDSTRVHALTLRDPGKTDYLTWREGGDHPQRVAEVTTSDGGLVFQGTVDLTAGMVTDWREVVGVQPSILFEEIFGITGVVLSDPGFREALARRNLADIDNVSCGPLTVGWFGIESEEGRRLMRVSCFDLDRTRNTFAKPIAGLLAIVDLQTQQVIDLIDNGVLPIPEDGGEYERDTVGTLQEPFKPVDQISYRGNNFEVEDGVVTWNNWRFHYRLDKRVGLIISDVTFRDNGVTRHIMHQGYMSEIYVPYMDPSEEHYWKVYMDSGEYGFGLLASPLFRGIDIPTSAFTDSITLPDDFGNPYQQADMVGIFERNTQDPAWRHFEFLHPDGPYFAGAPGLELVVRMISTIGNYDYTVDWIFRIDGSIKITTTANGIDNVKGVAAADMSDPTAAADTAYGTMIAPNTVAINHSHFFNFRLDLDIDGQTNHYARDRYVVETPESGPRQSIWKIEPHVVAKELEARTRFMPSSPAMWRFVNPDSLNRVGNPVSYRLIPGNSAMWSLMEADSFVALRGEFQEYNLWVTPYRAEERFAGGDFVNQKTETRGLLKWTGQDRNIENTDIVAWFTVGFHHVPRSEDWPVTPLVQRSFMLLPFNFYDRNPAINHPGFDRSIPNFKR